MSRKSYQNYARLARSDCSDTVAAGRYSNQVAAEKKIPADVLEKLKLGFDDDFLEIGCGPGSLLIPLSFFVSTATAVDHPDVLERLEKRYVDPNLTLIGHNFLDLTLDKSFSKILIYSVLQMLSNKDEFFKFLEKAVGLLAPGGMLLLGDLPNVDLKKRFLESSEGQKFLKEWKKEVDAIPTEDTQLDSDMETVTINDEFIGEILSFYISKGYEAVLLSQPPELPCGHTREDILIKAPIKNN